MLMLTAPIKRLTGVSEFLQRGLAASESVFGLLDTPGETDTGKVVIGRAKGRIAFDHVNLSYQRDDRWHCTTSALKFPPGKQLRWLALPEAARARWPIWFRDSICQLADASLWTATILADLTLASLRANIALVSQEVVLFNDTVAANIAYGQMREVPEAEIIAAAQAAHAMEFIKRHAAGIEYTGW